MKKLSSALVVLAVVAMVSFLLYNNRDTYSTSYKALCVNSCVKQDMTQQLERGNYTYILRNKKFSNFVLKYSDSLSASGAFYLTANYKDINGNIIRVKGMSFDIDKSEMKWPFIGDAAISFEDDKIYVYGNEKIFESVAEQFSGKLDEALHNMRNVAYLHDDDLKPKQLLNGKEK